MENNIIEPNEFFDFSGLSLAHPTGIQGGAYFTKIENNNKPLYIQTTKSVTRQGFVKTGKKYYCDLMFDKNADVLITWFENLEKRCQKLIFDRRDTWFENNLEESDIETAFNSTIRVYKSGKYYLVRTNVKSHNSAPFVKIYNENEVPLTSDDIKDGTNVISILEIQGIKFTSRNFQIEIELKQVMMLDNEPIFNSCLIKNKKGGVSKQPDILHPPLNTTNDIDMDSLAKSDELIGNILIKNEIIEDHSTHLDSLDDDEPVQLDDNVQDINIPIDSAPLKKSETTTENTTTENTTTENTTTENTITGDDSLELDIENLEPENTEDTLVLKEVDIDLSLENNLETLQLKKPNQVYFELYKEARSKAKLAKKAAIIAYLEAKNIKKTYILENLDDSDSDFDAEIDEVSESELEGL